MKISRGCVRKDRRRLLRDAFIGGEHGDVLLCVLGYGMLYNHAKAPVSPAQHLSKDFANLTYALHASPPHLRDARDGNVCVRFVARRGIEEGEELLIDYSDRTAKHGGKPGLQSRDEEIQVLLWLDRSLLASASDFGSD
eukprot:s440_g7.t1